MNEVAAEHHSITEGKKNLQATQTTLVANC